MQAENAGLLAVGLLLLWLRQQTAIDYIMWSVLLSFGPPASLCKRKLQYTNLAMFPHYALTAYVS